MKYVSRWIGVIFLAILIFLILRYGKIEEILAALKQLQPKWFIVVVVFELATYAVMALTWSHTLRKMGARVRFTSIIPLSVSKIFIDQTIPTGGLSGTLAVTKFLLNRGVTEPHAVGAVTVQIFSKYISYLAIFIVSAVILWFRHSLGRAFIYLSIAFTVIGIAVILIALYAWRKIRTGQLPRFLKRNESLKSLLASAKKVPNDLIWRPSVMLPAAGFQFLIFYLDGVTLWACIRGLGVPFSVTNAFAAHVISSIASTITFVPGGLGTIEGSLVGMLHFFGLSIEVGLVASLLFRVFTFWLPMIPGYIVTHYEIRKSAESS